MNVRPLHGPDREVPGAVCARLNVTARREAERGLQWLNEELEGRVYKRRSP